MKIHTIKIRHCGPKDCKESIVCHVLATDESKIMEHIDKELLSGIWNDRHEQDGLFEYRDEDYNVLGSEHYKERMLRYRGEFNDPNADYSDAYYGITHYGWDEGRDITEAEANIVLKLDLAVDLR